MRGFYKQEVSQSAGCEEEEWFRLIFLLDLGTSINE